MNNWYIITGAPCSGKTTLIDLLAQKGYKIVPELARVYIDQQLAQGITLAELRKDELAFQKKILQHKIDYEKKLDKKEMIFFDRGIPDSEAYYKLCGLESDDFLDKAVQNSSYKKAFLLDFLNFDRNEDYARTESPEEQRKLQILLEQTYQKLGIPLIKIPLLPEAERLKLILDNI